MICHFDQPLPMRLTPRSELEALASAARKKFGENMTKMHIDTVNKTVTVNETTVYKWEELM